ncbi:MAG TPA: stage III sporulation protein AF [bacterium]|nr:stage III sporulation protein AF [bacterium]
MTWLRDWVQTVIILVLFAGFLELLLPSGNMKPMVQVLVGLFVLLILLGPVTAMVDRIGHQRELGLPRVDETATQEILVRGKELEHQQLEQVLVQYKANIEQQVLSLLRFGGNAIKAQVIVDIISEVGRADFGKICSLRVILKSDGERHKEIEPELVAMLLTEYYDLTPDKVVVELSY